MSKRDKKVTVDPQELQRHIADYNRVFEKQVTRFVCPITLEEKEDYELMDGHFIPEAVLHAQRKTIIQWEEIDGFYGTRVEPALVDFLNMPKKSPFDLLRLSPTFTVTYDDGSTAEAFLWKGSTPNPKFPTFAIHHDGQFVAYGCARISLDDPRARESPVAVSGQSKQTLPIHWVATMVKAGYLANFFLHGYTAVKNPYGDAIRRTLHSYFSDKATREDAESYFRPYHNSVKLFFERIEGKAWRPMGNTLGDRTVMLHFTPSDIMFATTFMFSVSHAAVSVTLPYGSDDSDPVVVQSYYDQLMADETAAKQYVRTVRLDGRIGYASGKTNIRYAGDNIPESLKWFGDKMAASNAQDKSFSGE